MGAAKSVFGEMLENNRVKPLSGTLSYHRCFLCYILVYLYVEGYAYFSTWQTETHRCYLFTYSGIPELCNHCAAACCKYQHVLSIIVFTRRRFAMLGKAVAIGNI